MRIKKLRLVDGSIDANYTDEYLWFDPNEISHFIECRDRKALSGKKYPDVVRIIMKGSDLIYRARFDEFMEITK